MFEPKSRYSTAELTRAFEAVETPGDWRAPIECTLTDEELAAAGGWWCIYEAVGHFTATSPAISINEAARTNHITAVGYRAGPAGP